MPKGHLGAAKTSAFYAMALFVGDGLSPTFLREQPSLMFFAAISLMILGAWFVLK